MVDADADLEAYLVRVQAGHHHWLRAGPEGGEVGSVDSDGGLQRGRERWARVMEVRGDCH